MKKIIFIFIITCFGMVWTYGQQRTVKGKVTDGKNPMEDVVVGILDKDGIITNTDQKGFYSLAAVPGDVLTFSFLGMLPIQIVVEDVTRILNVTMVPDINALDEVTVKGSRRLSQQAIEEQYNFRGNIIRTAFGYIDAERASGSIRFLQEKDIRSVNLGILELLQNRFPGVQVYGSTIGARDLSTTLASSTSRISGDDAAAENGTNDQSNNLAGNNPVTRSNRRSEGPAVFIRGFSSIQSPQPAIFDIDGQVFVDVPIWLDVNNIKRLAILNNLATTTQYGALGAGGVVVINTIAGNTAPKQVVDQARLRNNFYQGDALGGAKLRANWPTYKKELYASANLDEAKMVYQKYAPTYSNSPYFLMDAQAYFVEKGDNAYAEKVVADNGTLLEGNPVLLKALAYQYQAQGNHASANELYKEVFLLRPNYAQSYLDMANSYRDLGRAKQAAAIYARYEYLLQEGFMESDSITLAPMMDRDFNNLLALQRDAVLDGKKRKSVYVAEDSFKGTRLVFEWNDGEAEFDLQFVNPEGQYSLWKHSLADNEALIGREKDFGYNMTEELIDGSLPGTWQVNVRYHGNKSLTPTYLKATVYHNYGEVSQRKEVKVFKLTLKDVNQELFRVQTTKGIVMR
ncbi:Putative outer membrane protein [Croceitalea dokdonensis DOKDO 023]|uniref:Putative outer membrane protein n=1 Tax=Croceitalea dokdonensis DOKDO 023 TaxID=1300341 RepID=A0A0P7B3S4_9FLAO|nr:hypothetical protein [Croceitalea dokdonensis]KPM33229.1 Putative outer membrane protein [Croceitalea dokdonensis DOKDO 023]